MQKKSEKKIAFRALLGQMRTLFTSLPLDAYAAQSAFFIILSFFPFLLLLLSVCRQLSIADGTLADDLLSFVPQTVTELLTFVFQEISQSTNMAMISLSAGAALWSCSRGVYVLVKGFNAVYGVKETRSSLWRRVLAVGHTVLFMVTLLFTLTVLVYGKMLVQMITPYAPGMARALLWVLSFRSLGGIFMLTVIFLVLFLVLPNRRSHVRRELPGAFFSATAWMAFSGIYSYFTERFSRMPTLYGSFAAVILLLLWLYYCLYLLLLGAMLNRMLGSKNK